VRVQCFIQYFSQNRCLVGPRDQENNQCRLIDGRSRQGKPVQPFFGHMDFGNPAPLLFQDGCAGKEGCRVAVLSKSQQYQIKSGTTGGKKDAQKRFIFHCGFLSGAVADHWMDLL